MADKKTIKKAPAKKSVSSASSSSSGEIANVSASSRTNPNTTLPADSQPVSTSDMVGGTSRNAVIEGNETMNIDDIRQRAYELYEERGGVPGNDADDWFRAEQEVRSRRNGNGKKSA